MIKLPNDNKKITQTNRSDILGNVWSSFGLDLQSNVGVIQVSPRLKVNTTGVSNQGLAVAFAGFDQRIWALAGTRIFKNSSYDLTTAFTEDASTNAITNYLDYTGDMTLFNSTLVTTSNDKLMSKAANGSGTGAWTNRATLGGSSQLHKMVYFRKFNRLYYLDSNSQIKSLDSGWVEATSGSYFIDLGFNSGLPYTMEADDRFIWIGTAVTSPSSTINTTSGAKILTWDGISGQITNEYILKATGVKALCRDDSGVMHAMDNEGALLKFAGNGFVEIGRLPFKNKLGYKAASNLYDSFIHPNGLKFTRNGTFKVLVNNLNGDNDGTINENLPSGIWEWSADTGFVHCQPLTYNTVGSTSITDYGQNRVSAIGGLWIPEVYTTSSSGRSSLICGATLFTDASSTATSIFCEDPLNTTQKYGYFVTSWVHSQQIQDTWQKLWLKYRRFLASDDKIVAKYRTKEATATEISITWVNTTSFTTSTDLTNYTGYEVEVIQGTGSGKCSHISSVVHNVLSGTWTANLDETYTGVTTGTAKARLQNWTKCGIITGQTDESSQLLIETSSERVQVKVCAQFTGEDQIFQLAITNATKQPIV